MKSTNQRHRTALPAVGAALALSLAIPAADLDAQVASSYQLDGSRVAVYNLAGRMDVVRGSGSQVVVRIDAQGSDADRLSVEIDDIRGRADYRRKVIERLVAQGLGELIARART